MIFIPFSLPPKEYTHWALCPMAKELILFKQDKRGCPYCDNGIWAIILDGEGKEIAPPIACPVCGDK